jgi:hypothetical protein
VAEPMPLELFFAADRTFRRMWEGAVCDTADKVMGAQLAREQQEGITPATVIEEIPVPLSDEAEGEGFMQFATTVPWVPSIMASPETISATFNCYVVAEVQRRLDQRAGK